MPYGRSGLLRELMVAVGCEGEGNGGDEGRMTTEGMVKGRKTALHG